MELLQWVILLCLIGIKSQVTAKDDDLFHHLMNSTRYNKCVRPVTNSNNPVIITFGLSLHNIIDLEDKKQVLSLRITMRESWIDSSLSWQPSDFDGIKTIALHTRHIWIPDIVLYNDVGEGFGDGGTRTNALVRHDGHVSLSIPSILQSTCKVHMQSYPFDMQICSIKFGSWSFDGSQLALHMESPDADLSSFVPNVEWELVEIPGEFHSLMYTCCVNPYHDIEFLVKIKRRSLFHAMYLIIPCAVISLLTLLMFLLPPECNERMTVGMAILVGLSFFFLLVAENMPATSEGVPLIGIYYTMTLIEISVAFFMTCVVLRLHHHNPVHGEVPQWMKVYLMGTAARFMGFRFDNKKTARQDIQSQKDQKSHEVLSSTKDHQEIDDKNLVHSRNSRAGKPTVNQNEEAENIIAGNIEKQEMLEKRQEGWQMAALVLNSIFMWTYIVAIVISFTVLLVPPLISAM